MPAAPAAARRAGRPASRAGCPEHPAAAAASLPAPAGMCGLARRDLRASLNHAAAALADLGAAEAWPACAPPQAHPPARRR